MTATWIYNHHHVISKTVEKCVAPISSTYIAITYLSSELNVSISVMLPVIYGIVRIMQPSNSDSTVIRNFKSVVIKELNQQWHLDDINPSKPSVTLLATLLDLRFNDTKFFKHS